MDRTHKWIAFESLMTARVAVNGIGAPFLGSTGRNPALFRGYRAFSGISG